MSRLDETATDASDREALEAERDFLLRSLDDLEAEREAGNIDDDTYRVLHDDYTARAAAAVRAVDDDAPASRPPASPATKASTLQRVLVSVGVVAFAVIAAVLLANAVGDRRPGQTLTGNRAADDSEAASAAELARLKADVAAQPDDYATRIAYARALLAENPAAALEQYGAARDIDDTQAEPPTYMGWIYSLTARALPEGKDRERLVDNAIDQFGQALVIDAKYPPAYVFRGLTRYQMLNDPEAAVADFQQYLAYAPESDPMREMVRGALQQAMTDAGTTTSSTTVPTQP